ncbi:tyrosine-protein kinase receptor Tie-1-like [Acanthaster planci]|uniref:Tyrosine-protein kinase receptor Tie-1-like n=1 Tax=Acanthaster planci TaxID=133434 RepID=A0A8B7XTI0_ACAPL|nr:tyrosine-protein kinase receptor Tie-1-like [Acanthaster planci]
MILRGYRMHKPSNCDDETYALMCSCWKEDPYSRPTFTDLVYILSDMADKEIKHTYMDVTRSHLENLHAIQQEFD